MDATSHSSDAAVDGLDTCDDAERDCVAELERLGELRPDRHTTPDAYRYGVLFCGPFIGALSIFSGYTVFLAVIHYQHLEHGPRTLILELLGAAGAVAVIDWVKDVIEPDAHPRRSRRNPAFILSSVLLLIVFEMFVIGTESATHTIQDVPWTEIFTPEFVAGASLDLGIQAAVGILIGAGLVLVLAKAVFRSTGRMGTQINADAATGAMWGLLTAPALMIVYIVGSHAGSKLLGFNNPADPSQHVELLTLSTLSLSAIAEQAARARAELFADAAIAAIILYCARRLRFGPVSIGLIAFGGVVLGPGMILSGHPFIIALIAAGMCGVAGLVLGSVAPVLRLSSCFPDGTWPWLTAFGVSLGAVGVWQHAYWLAGPAGIVIVTGLAVRHHFMIQDYWALIALSIAIVVVTLTSILSVVFAGAFAQPLLLANLESSDYWGKLWNAGQSHRIFTVFQMSVMGSLGFWGSVGLLMARQIQHHQTCVRTCEDEKPRCFWAGCDDLRAYHDREYGTVPANDRELFVRLSIAVLSHGVPPGPTAAMIRELCQGFDQDAMASFDAATVARRIRHAQAPARRQLGVSAAAAALAAANARAFGRYYERHSAADEIDAGRLILDALLSHAEDPNQAIDAFREHFAVADGFALGSFLQDIGVLPGAHFKDCYLHDVRARARHERIQWLRSAAAV